MAFPAEMMHEKVWFNRRKYEEAENHYQLFLTNNISAQLSSSHAKDSTDGISKVNKPVLVINFDVHNVS